MLDLVFIYTSGLDFIKKKKKKEKKRKKEKKKKKQYDLIPCVYTWLFIIIMAPFAPQAAQLIYDDNIIIITMSSKFEQCTTSLILKVIWTGPIIGRQQLSLIKSCNSSLTAY